MDSRTKNVIIALVIIVGIYLLYTKYNNSENFTSVAVGSGFKFCSNENQTCSIPSPNTVVFGTPTSNVQVNMNGPASFPCTNGQFGGDPAPGIVKACYVKSNGPSINVIPGSLQQINYNNGMLCGVNSNNDIYCKAMVPNTIKTHGGDWKNISRNGMILSNVGTDGNQVYGSDNKGIVWTTNIPNGTCDQDPNKCTFKSINNIPGVKQMIVGANNQRIAVGLDNSIFTIG